MPRWRSFFRSRKNSTTVPMLPEIDVASARPLTPMSQRKRKLNPRFRNSISTDTHIVVFVSCIAW
ncbi:MAG: hypothetical protein BWY81_00902 [Firmicutes bacterium ADurb.Bin467]|nr:MAG: hypothetical protein BWY81_00902 [Firmicutes bacterium ADurb.Bin467]